MPVSAPSGQTLGVTTVSAETIAVDLKHVRTKSQLLDTLGALLELGGPKGNMQVRDSQENLGWGKNWDALADGLSYLDVGGIWGSSRIPTFPLELVFTNWLAYSHAEPAGWATLTEILESTRAVYAKRGLAFNFRTAP